MKVWVYIIAAALWLWKFSRAYIAALGLIALVVLVVWSLVSTEHDRVENLRFALSVQSIIHEAKLEKKKQRLAIVLSHLDDNPELKAPDNKHLRF